MKERLTGAIILVVLVVALVPELLSGPKSAPPPKPISTADGTPIRSVIIHLSDPVAASTTAPASAPAPTVASTSAPTPALTTAAAEPVPSPPPTAAAAPAAATEPASAGPAEVPTPAPPPVRSPTAAGHPRPAAAAARPAPPAAAPVAVAGAVAASGSPATAAFLVQAGLFSNRANANRLVQELATHGLDAHLGVQKKGAAEFYQVRVGPAGDRAQATALLGRVKAAGSSGVLVPAGARSP